MNEMIEYMREKLHKVMESGSFDEILRVSQELDQLIVFYMQNQTRFNKKSA